MLNSHDVSLTNYASQDLPRRNRTTVQELIAFSLSENCVVVTKDADFVESFLLKHEPRKLLLVSTGNIGNDDLLRLFQLNIDQLVEAFESFDFIEVNRTSMISHQ